jgi:Response regulators consisting of a CheY-like receiver domain and a winged-helix DNA-binding domain
MVRILIVEDNANIGKLMSERLRMEGYETALVSDGRAALDYLSDRRADLVVSDIMMPGLDGYALTEKIRARDPALPILIVTAKDSYDDKRRGFSLGADDYLVKPIDINELALRVAALLRRAKIAAEKRIVVGDVVIDEDELSIRTGRGEIELPKKEFQILFTLLSSPKKIFTRRQLMDQIWGMDSESMDRTVDSHVKRLRKRLEGIDEFEIVTIRGLGYKAERKA